MTEIIKQRTPGEIFNDTVTARAEVLGAALDLDDINRIKEYLASVNLEGLTDNDKKVLAELLPYAAGLMIPGEIEDNPDTKALFDMINAAEINAGENMLLPEDGETPSDECVKDAVANFRAFTIALQKLGVLDIVACTEENIINAMARMFIDIRLPVPPEILEKISDDEYENLKLMSFLHTQGSNNSEREFRIKNEQIRLGEVVSLPMETQLATAGNIRKILDIEAEIDRCEHQRELDERNKEQLRLFDLYSEFIARHPDLKALTPFILDQNGKADLHGENRNLSETNGNLPGGE